LALFAKEVTTKEIFSEDNVRVSRGCPLSPLPNTGN